MVRREIDSICRSGRDPLAVCRDAAEVLAGAVPFDRWCALLLDPATLLNTAGYHDEGLPVTVLPRLVELEASGEDVNPMPGLMRSRTGVSTLHRATGGDPRSSGRYRDVLEPSGLGRELRAVLRDRGRAWGGLVLFRETAAPDFGSSELGLLAAVGPVLAQAVRRGLLFSELTHRDTEHGPGMAVLAVDDGALEVETLSRAAREWLDDIPDGRVPGSGLPVGVVTLVHRAMAAPEGSARSRLRTASGRWLSLQVDTLETAGRPGRRLSLILEPTRPHELADVIAAAYGLSDREREIARLTVAGYTNREMAAELWLSQHTVQDHLKKVFAKLGVSSRAELTGRLFFDHYLPRQSAGRPVGGDGWYIDDPH